MSVSLVFFALALGAVVAVYFPMISQMARVLGSAPLANVPFFGMAFLASILIAIATGSRGGDFARLPSVPLWLWTAGVMSAGLIIGSSYLIPRIGVGAFMVLMVSGQVLAGMAFGQLGLFGMSPTPLTLAKLAGAAMVIAGVYLVTLK